MPSALFLVVYAAVDVSDSQKGDNFSSNGSCFDWSFWDYRRQSIFVGVGGRKCQNNGPVTGAIFFLCPGWPGLAPRAKCRVRLAWLITRLLCRLRTLGHRCITCTWGFFVSGTCECRNVVTVNDLINARFQINASYLMNTPSVLLKLNYTPLSKKRPLSCKRPLREVNMVNAKY